jgi:hypothetical protein
MKPKNALPSTVDPVLQELWQVKDAISERFGSLDAYVKHLREKASIGPKPLIRKRSISAVMPTNSRSKRVVKTA